MTYLQKNSDLSEIQTMINDAIADINYYQWIKENKGCR